MIIYYKILTDSLLCEMKYLHNLADFVITNKKFINIDNHQYAKSMFQNKLVK